MPEISPVSAQIDSKSATVLYGGVWESEQQLRTSEPIFIIGKIGGEGKGKIAASLIVKRKVDSGGGDYEEESRIVNIGDIRAQSKFRKMGLGKAMLVELERVAKRVGVSKMTAKVTDSDVKETPWLLEFYKKRGFEAVEKGDGWEIFKLL